jgi:3-oxoacyl-[acyl-carrier protein] reductase
MASILRIEGKVVFITGSTRGIGWATACAFAQQKAIIVLNGQSDQRLLNNRITEIQEKFNVECMGFLADAADSDQIKSCYQTIFKKFGRLDVLVNNAGILDDSLLGMITDRNIKRCIEVNTIGAIHHLQSASRLMARNVSGSIINITSIIGRRGNPGQVVYAASKAAVIGMTLSASKELVAKNIRVNAVAPGVIDTDMIKHINPRTYQDLRSTIGMGRIGSPDEVAGVVLFLASDLSNYVTGQIIGVDGGMII